MGTYFKTIWVECDRRQDQRVYVTASEIHTVIDGDNFNVAQYTDISSHKKKRDGQSYEIRKITLTLPLEVKAPLAHLHPSRSTIETGGDTTIPSPGRSPKQPLPGIGLHNPLHDRQACPEFNSFHQGVSQVCLRGALFPCRPLNRRGLICDIPHPPNR